MPARARRKIGVLLAVPALALTGCTSEGSEPQVSGDETVAGTASASPTSAAVAVTTNLTGGPVAVDEQFEVTASDGTLEKVVVRSGPEKLEGDLSDDGTSWSATDRLEPGKRYRVRSIAVDEQGRRKTERSTFRTEDLPLERQTYPSIAPLEGETVGVGMPVIVQFDVPVTDRASIERHLSVESTPKQAGAWHWVSSEEVHWRPRKYWKPGTQVTVDADINSVSAGNGVYGQLSRRVSFEIGDSVVSKVNVKDHRMKVFINGKLARTMPISAGKPGFITRSGTKVIIEKVRDKVMDAATLGIAKDDPEYYRLDVEYAMRVTYSGEFLHAAPWSSDSQGFANVSHGCVGMSTSNAAWLFGLTKRGDVVEVSGSNRQMSLYNGYGDWNASFDEYAEGSALS
ncbi:MAG TPA: Ig-like domain-containing protein [Nocardioidaceae bacterium]|nr:Ig-like domain-containing protein [Nocardioidaceae bacterium]